MEGEDLLKDIQQAAPLNIIVFVIRLVTLVEKQLCLQLSVIESRTIKCVHEYSSHSLAEK